jgi:broad specificity phosphatase PhoE
MSNIMKNSALFVFGFAPPGLAIMTSTYSASGHEPLLRPDLAAEVDVIEIVAIRHGESTWNARKNAKKERKSEGYSWKNPRTWGKGKDQSWGTYWHSWLDSFTFAENWYGIGRFTDAALSEEGESQAKKIHTYFEQHDGYPAELKEKTKAGEVAFATSNLRRAQDTLKYGFKDVIPTEGDHQDVYIMSDLQESELGADAGESMWRSFRRRWVPQWLLEEDEAKYQRTFQYNGQYNFDGWWGTRNWRPRWYDPAERAKRSLDDFFQLHDKKGKDLFVFAGHSHKIREMMKLLVPKERSDTDWWSKPTDVTACHEKLENGGAMKFKVERHEGSYQIVEGSWSELPQVTQTTQDAGSTTSMRVPGLQEEKSNEIKMLQKQQSRDSAASFTSAHSSDTESGERTSELTDRRSRS